jgi:hypothetical protein
LCNGSLTEEKCYLHSEKNIALLTLNRLKGPSGPD